MNTIKSTLLLFATSMLIISYTSARILNSLNILVINNLRLMNTILIIVIIVLYSSHIYYFFTSAKQLSQHLKDSVDALFQIININNLIQNDYLVYEVNGVKSSIFQLQKILLVIILIFPPSLIYVMYYIINKFRSHLIHEYKAVYLISYLLKNIKPLGGDLFNVRKFTDFLILSILTFGMYNAYNWYKFSKNLENHLKIYNKWYSELIDILPP